MVPYFFKSKNVMVMLIKGRYNEIPFSKFPIIVWF